MNKMILAACLLLGSIGLADVTVPAQPVDMKTAPMCLFQQLKQGDTYFVIACGADIVMSHDVAAFSKIEDPVSYRQTMENAMKQLMGSDASITCQQTESEIALLIICKR